MICLIYLDRVSSLHVTLLCQCRETIRESIQTALINVIIEQELPPLSEHSSSYRFFLVGFVFLNLSFFYLSLYCVSFELSLSITSLVDFYLYCLEWSQMAGSNAKVQRLPTTCLFARCIQHFHQQDHPTTTLAYIIMYCLYTYYRHQYSLNTPH